MVTSLAQTIILLLLARFAFGVELPTEPQRWFTFAWVYLLGITTSALLGIAISRLPRSGKSATAVIIPPLLILQFVSGVYLAFTALPSWLQNIASAFPLRWLAQGMRSVFLPDDFAAAERSGSWDLSTVALVLAAWLLGGLVTTLATFRWIRRDG
jgi:ABC-2 type transport system permease protein